MQGHAKVIAKVIRLNCKTLSTLLDVFSNSEKHKLMKCFISYEQTYSFLLELYVGKYLIIYATDPILLFRLNSSVLCCLETIVASFVRCHLVRKCLIIHTN